VEELEAVKEAAINSKKESKKKGDHNYADFYKPRWCAVCNAFKPPRAHHCRDLNKCILRMDHYCPWVRNCVGYRNHKFFILFLSYASFCLVFLLIACIVKFFIVVTHSPDKFDLPVQELLGFMSQMVFMFPVTFCVVGLWFYQISLLFENLTSIESMLFDSYKYSAKKRGLNEFRWFYDHGTVYNIKQVMGLTVGEWFLPTLPEHIKNGDGSTFKTRMLNLEDIVVEKEDQNTNSINTQSLNRENLRCTIKIKFNPFLYPMAQSEHTVTLITPHRIKIVPVVDLIGVVF
jgi:hypothetical protein